MALPKEPRQKMINLMYLVLTALLALNVSAEILNAFKTVNRSIEETNTIIDASTGEVMTSLMKKTTDSETAEKAKIWFAKAKQIQDSTDALNKYIQDLKDSIYAEAGFNPKKNGDSTFKEDNQDIATRLLVEGKYGKELFNRLASYKKNMLAIDPLIAREFANSLQINLSAPRSTSQGNRTWEAAYFRMVPTVAAITILSKFQNDVRTTENKLITFCHQQVGKVEIVFDQFAPIVGQSSNYLMPNQELTITAGVGAFNSQAQPQISIGGQSYQVEKGVATATIRVGNSGGGSVPIVINYVDQDNKPQVFRTEAKYTIGTANAAISLPDMNVLYIGIDNKVVVSGGGVGAEKLRVGISGGGGSISGSNGNYVVRVSQITDQCTITASTTDGKTLGGLTFRVRTIPRATATVGGYESGASVSKGAFAAQAGVGAGIKDFPLNLSYKVTSFEVVADDPESGDIIAIPCQGNTWSEAARRAISRLQPGGIITIENIRCLGPDGRTTTLPSLLYNIK
jgi:gliding motility-associated protein GldM